MTCRSGWVAASVGGDLAGVDQLLDQAVVDADLLERASVKR